MYISPFNRGVMPNIFANSTIVSRDYKDAKAILLGNDGGELWYKKSKIGEYLLLYIAVELLNDGSGKARGKSEWLNLSLGLKTEQDMFDRIEYIFKVYMGGQKYINIDMHGEMPKSLRWTKPVEGGVSGVLYMNFNGDWATVSRLGGKVKPNLVGRNNKGRCLMRRVLGYKRDNISMLDPWKAMDLAEKAVSKADQMEDVKGEKENYTYWPHDALYVFDPAFFLDFDVIKCYNSL